MSYNTEVIDAAARATGPQLREVAQNNRIFGISIGTTDDRNKTLTPKAICLVTLFGNAYLFPWHSTLAPPKPFKALLDIGRNYFFGIGIHAHLHYFTGNNPAKKNFINANVNKSRIIDLTKMGSIITEPVMKRYCDFEDLPIIEDEYIFILFEKVLGLNVSSHVKQALKRIQDMLKCQKLKPGSKQLQRHPELKDAAKLFWNELKAEYIQKYLLVKGFLPLAEINILILLAIIVPNLLQYHEKGVVFRSQGAVQHEILRCIDHYLDGKSGHPPIDYKYHCSEKNTFTFTPDQPEEHQVKAHAQLPHAKAQAQPHAKAQAQQVAEEQARAQPEVQVVAQVEAQAPQIIVEEVSAFQITAMDPLDDDIGNISAATVKQLIEVVRSCQNTVTSVYVASASLYDYLGQYGNDEVSWCTYVKRNLDEELRATMQYPHPITHVVGLFDLNGVPSAFNVELIV